MIDDASKRVALSLGCPHEATAIWDHGYGGARDSIHLAPFIVLIDALISTRLIHTNYMYACLLPTRVAMPGASAYVV